MLPHVASLFSKITKQFIDQSQQAVYPTPSPAVKEGQGDLSVPVPAAAVPTVPTQRRCKQRARAGTGRSWPRCAKCPTDKSWASLHWIALLLGSCSFLNSGLTCLPSSAFTSGLRSNTLTPAHACFMD